MIIKGSQRSGAKAIADHLTKTDDNDHVDILELRGFAAGDLEGALLEVEAAAKGTRCKQPFFSVSLNPPGDYSPTEKEFRQAAAKIEAKYPALKNQARAMVMHEKNGRRHCHVVWSRINENAKAVQLSHSKEKLKDVSKAMYAVMERKAPAGVMEKGKADPRNYDLKTWQQGKRMGEDPRDLKQTVQQAWASSDNRAAFEHALAQHDLYLAKGDKRGFVLVHPSGEVMSLSRYAGVPAKDLKARLGDPEQLRTVEEISRLMKQGEPAASIERSRAARERQREALRPLDDERRRMTAKQREERQAVDRRDPGRQRTMDRQLHERRQLQGRIEQVKDTHRAERQREREQQRFPLAAIERQKTLFEIWANARRAELQNERLEAEGELGREHHRQRLAEGERLDQFYKPYLDPLKAEAAQIKARQDKAEGVRGLVYRMTGRAARDRERGDEIKADIADLEQRKAERMQIFEQRRGWDIRGLADRHAERERQLERRIERVRDRREADGWKPLEAVREKATGQRIDAQRDEGAEKLTVEGRENSAGETTPGNAEATTAQPEAAQEAEKTLTAEEAERNARIDAEQAWQEARAREYQQGHERGDTGRVRTRY